MKDIDLHLLNAQQSFKKAINHAFDLGWEASEERIIKLLEEMPIKAIKTEHGSQILSLELKDIIALIKGEK